MIGLVLSGGGAKGAYQIGALQALREVGYEFGAVAGVSVGALNATLIAQGDFKVLSEVWLGLNSSDIYSGHKILGAIRALVGFSSIYSTGPLKRLIDTYVDSSRVKIPLTIGTVSLNDGRLLEVAIKDGIGYWGDGREIHVLPSERMGDVLKKAILASASIPLVFPPQNFIHKLGYYVDGGVRQMTPLKSILQHGPKKVVIINCNPRSVTPTDHEFKRAIRIGSRSLEIAMNEIFVQDVDRFLDINALIQQVGGTATNRNGKELSYFEPIIIEPTQNIGDSINFSPENSKRLMLLGYNDTLRIIQDES